YLLDDGHHLVGKPARNDEQIRLARGAAEHLAAELRDVIPRRGQIHHFNRAAGKTERQRPKRRLLRPADELVDGRRQKLAVRRIVRHAQSKPPFFQTYKSPRINTIKKRAMAPRP